MGTEATLGGVPPVALRCVALAAAVYALRGGASPAVRDMASMGIWEGDGRGYVLVAPAGAAHAARVLLLFITLLT